MIFVDFPWGVSIAYWREMGCNGMLTRQHVDYTGFHGSFWGILAWIHSRIRTWGFHPQTGMCTTLLGLGQGKSTRTNMGHWFPECVAKAKASGWSLALGVGGLGVEVCSLGVTLPAAAGRNRRHSQWGTLAGAAKVVVSGSLKRDVFEKASKVVLCDRRNTFKMLFLRWLAFFCGRRSTLRYPCVFFLAGAAR